MPPTWAGYTSLLGERRERERERKREREREKEGGGEIVW